MATGTRGRRRAKKRTPTVLEQLISGTDAERVAVHFLDGRSKEGALLFNAIKRSGKLINVEEEFSLDFDTHEVKAIKVLRVRVKASVSTAEAASASGSRG